MSVSSVHLTPSSSSSVPGISLNTGIGATVVNDQWNINVATQQGADLSIALDSRWGFHPDFISSIQLHIDGNTPNETYQNDGEILLVFNVNDEYFAEMISIDERRLSYKQCPNTNDALISRDVTEMIISTLPDRYHRFCKNEVNTPVNNATDYWTNVDPIYKFPSQWPMFITLTNDPIANTISYLWTDVSDGLHKVLTQYTSSFATNQGLNIYISGESPNENFLIFSIDIIYTYNISTPNTTPITPISSTHSTITSHTTSITEPTPPSSTITSTPSVTTTLDTTQRLRERTSTQYTTNSDTTNRSITQYTTNTSTYTKNTSTYTSNIVSSIHSHSTTDTTSINYSSNTYKTSYTEDTILRSLNEYSTSYNDAEYNALWSEFIDLPNSSIYLIVSGVFALFIIVISFILAIKNLNEHEKKRSVDESKQNQAIEVVANVSVDVDGDKDPDDESVQDKEETNSGNNELEDESEQNANDSVNSNENEESKEEIVPKPPKTPQSPQSPDEELYEKVVSNHSTIKSSEDEKEIEQLVLRPNDYDNKDIESESDGSELDALYDKVVKKTLKHKLKKEIKKKDEIRIRINTGNKYKTKMNDETARFIKRERNKEEIKTWLRSMDGLEEYYPIFIQNGYDSLSFIVEITNMNQLEDIGIYLKGHQTKFMAEIKRLRNLRYMAHINDDVKERGDETRFVSQLYIE